MSCEFNCVARSYSGDAFTLALGHFPNPFVDLKSHPDKSSEQYQANPQNREGHDSFDRVSDVSFRLQRLT